jgi:hypothetical protein
MMDDQSPGEQPSSHSEAITGENATELPRQFRERSDPWLSAAVLGQIGLVVTLIPSLIVLMRVILLSSGSPTVVATMVTTLNLTAAFLGTMVQVLPFYLYVTIFGLAWMAKRRFERRSFELIIAYLLLAFLAYSTIYVSAPVHLAFAAIFGFQLLMLLVVHRRRPLRSLANVLAGAAILAIFAPVLFLFGVALNVKEVWLPSEVIALKDGSTRSAYVLRVEDDWVTILRRDRRDVEVLKKDDIVGRTICESASSRSAQPQPFFWITPIGSYLDTVGRPAMPRCPV